MKIAKISTLAFAALFAIGASAQKPLNIERLKDGHAQIRVTADQKNLILPIEEGAAGCQIKVQVDNTTAYTFTACLAVNKVDFTVPFAPAFTVCLPAERADCLMVCSVRSAVLIV